MAKDWSKLYKKYKGLWVALADDEETVMGSGTTAKEAWDQARARIREADFESYAGATYHLCRRLSRMKFKYARYGRDILRPVIPVEVIGRLSVPY